MRALFSFITAAAVLAGPMAGPAPAQETVQVEPGTVDAPRGDLFIRDLDAAWTATGEVLENVSIVVRDGVIREIGSDLSAPRGAEVLDGRGMTAMPGIVDEHTHTAMDRGTNEGTSVVTPEVRVVDAIDPEDYGIYRALSGGVTSGLVLHGSSNPIGGQAAVIKMRWGMEKAKNMLVDGAPRIVKFALGENVTDKNWRPRGPRRFPHSREGVESIYVQAFTAAQEYKETWDAYRQNPDDYRAPPRRDLRLEALVDIMEGDIRVHAHSYRSDEILMLMNVAERFGFKIDVFTHVLEGYKVADEMAEHGAGGSTFSDWWMYKLEAHDAIPYNAAIMHEHGVLTSLNSDIPWLQTTMVYEMNKPLKYGGLSKEEALRMVTRYPAEQVGIADKVGTLESGKQADIVLLSGDPFNVFSRVEQTIVDGIVYYDRSRDAEFRGFPVRDMPEIGDGAPVAADGGADERADGAAFAFEGADGPVTAFVGATVHPVAGPEIPNGVVLVQGERIAAVGAAGQVSVPDGAQQIDLSGKHLYPGMIDPMTQLGMVEIGSIPAARDDREVGDYNPHVRALTGVHPHSTPIPVARANGITAALSVPSTGTIQGAASVIQLSGDTPETMSIEDRAALVVDFPSPKGEHWDEPSLEGEDLEELIELFERAGLYAERSSTRDDPTAPFEPNANPREQHLLEALAPAVTGDLPVLFEVRRERDIRSLLLFLDAFPTVDAALVGADQAFRVADELARRDIPVIVGSSIRPTMDRHDPIDAGWKNAAVLHGAGVRVAFSTQDVELLRNLPYHAARSAAFGLPRDAALRGVTLAPAEILGLGDEMGSIEVGKRADLIVTDGDPLQITTEVERVFIAGDETSMESKHTRLWEKFRDR